MCVSGTTLNLSQITAPPPAPARMPVHLTYARNPYDEDFEGGGSRRNHKTQTKSARFGSEEFNIA